MTKDRIHVPVVESEARRDQLERRVFEQLGALRIAERVDAAVPAPRRFAWGWIAAGGFAAVACVVALVLAFRHGDSTPRSEAIAAAPSRIQTPVGGSSRFTVDDAVIDAGSDTSLVVQQDAATGVALVLARGSVDCDVEPRRERRFRVVAGDVTVAVVGTRFSVSRLGAIVRVEVARGKVRVTSPNGERFVAAGESWSNAPETAVALPLPVPAPPVQPPAPPTVDHPVAPTGQAAFAAAQHLEPRDRAAAARAYRAVANGKDSWAALALYSLAELDVTGHDAAAALAVLDEYGRRFPRGANAEDIAWLRVEALRDAGRQGDAGAAAAAYLRTFPRGTYVKAAERIADPPR